MFVEEAEAVCQWGFDGMSAVGAFMFEGYTFGDAELAVKFGTVGVHCGLSCFAVADLVG